MNISNKDIKDIYIKYKNILSGCRTIYDSLYFAQYFIKINPECKNLINGMIHGKHYEKISDFRSIVQILNKLNEFKSRNEVDEYINTNIKDNFDYAQINSFIRLGRTKTFNKINKNDNYNEIFKLNTLIDKNIDVFVDKNIDVFVDKNIDQFVDILKI